MPLPNTPSLFVVACLTLALSSPIAFAQERPDSLVAELLSLRADHETEKASLETQLSNVIREQRSHWNQVSSDAWAGIESRAAWEKFREEKMAKLAASLGQFPATPAQMNVQVTGRIERASDGFVIENLVYESRPGLWVSGNLYKPLQIAEQAPGILLCHAHHTPKEHGELQDMGMTWARAGCYVLVPDHLGHGERRQHPFVSQESYSGPFRVSRQDYYFRYDSGVQLHLLGDSLMGWFSWDLSRGVDVLLKLPQIDPKKILLLGAVAGGGDPCAVTAALDGRIAAAAVFNFGGPQPETRYPLPDDAETSFNYAGSGSWESTRGLVRTTFDGTLPWVIVSSIAPRRLIYAHEFDWDQARDPVWKRLQSVYQFFDQPDHLAFTHGRGGLRGQPPEATHCTHIGAFHRQRIHQAFHDWFQIKVTPNEEFRQRVPVDSLRCFTDPMTQETHNRLLKNILPSIANQRMAEARNRRRGLSSTDSRDQLRVDWNRILGEPVALSEAVELSKDSQLLTNIRVDRVRLRTDTGIQVPLILMRPKEAKVGQKTKVVLVSSHVGKRNLLQRNAAEYAGLLRAGFAICLPDARGIGESSVGAGRGRNSPATDVSASLLMLRDPLIAGQLRDLRSVCRWLGAQVDIDSTRIWIWGDSRSATVPPAQVQVVPRDDDASVPPFAETSGCMLSLLLSLYEDSIAGICLSGGVADFQGVLEHPQIRIPHDGVVPGLFTTGDLSDLAAHAITRHPLRIEAPVNATNRHLTQQELDEYQSKLKQLVPGVIESNLIASQVIDSVHWLTQSMHARAFELRTEQITAGPKHHFFGYIGQCQTIPWSGDGRYILALEIDNIDRMPRPADAAKIVLVDTHRDNELIPLDETYAWNPQQGTMFYWNPKASRSQFFFNDRDLKTGDVFAVLYDIERKERIREYRHTSAPVGNSGVAQNGGEFLALNYGRLARLRAVTGYPEARDWSKSQNAPDDDGIFVVDVDTGRRRLLVSYRQLADQLKHRVTDVEKTALFINHTLWNRNGDRVYFFVRGGWGELARGGTRINVPCSIHLDGTHLSLHDINIGGHPEWAQDHILIGSSEGRQILYDVDSQKILGQLGSKAVFPNPEGDISLSPDGNWLANGYKEGTTNRYVIYRLSDASHARSDGIDKGPYQDDIRIDPAPCWNRDNSAILTTGIATDQTRQLFIIRVLR